ncbi:putative DNA-binding transcriptional regulator AlpA [Bradyrhizobium japonicum USDA 38]|uniref:helix-turn-helix transcriptional regulator n=1 Tax=Bradyrhizobium japonicum TaxID=375 RepID=UPI0004185669|nr:transcriptional regulator [Bradyrhizobium japonicum]MCS3895798.1 putative DNA-binding transcriptional regulator AlpA [Bradyrhizobium japonicum USDA 38]MCS3948313.1 putative DNA-binding transcriptional regulator AlpA [Bradyrhizobium japonicum]
MSQGFAGDIESDRVLSFDDWCKLNGFSRSTGQRLIANGQGPVFVRLSVRRKGVTVAENRRWQASRMIETAA